MRFDNYCWGITVDNPSNISEALVKTHQTPDGNCGIYSIACQIASLYVQAELHPEVKEKLALLYQTHQEAFIDFFHCLNRFHKVPNTHSLTHENFGKFIRENIHTYRDLELLVGTAMRFHFEAKKKQYREDDTVILTLQNLKKDHTEATNLFQLCQSFGLNLLFYNNTIDETTVIDFSTFLEGAASAAPFSIRILFSGGNHYDSVFKFKEMNELNFELVQAELENPVMYVDSKDPEVLKDRPDISGEEVWRYTEEANLFIHKIMSAILPDDTSGETDSNCHNTQPEPKANPHPDSKIEKSFKTKIADLFKNLIKQFKKQPAYSLFSAAFRLTIGTMGGYGLSHGLSGAITAISSLLNTPLVSGTIAGISLLGGLFASTKLSDRLLVRFFGEQKIEVQLNQPSDRDEVNLEVTPTKTVGLLEYFGQNRPYKTTLEEITSQIEAQVNNLKQNDVGFAQPKSKIFAQLYTKKIVESPRFDDFFSTDQRAKVSKEPYASAATRLKS